MNTRTSPAPPHAQYFPAPAAEAPLARWLARLRDDVRELVHFRGVLGNMVAQDLRVRYQRSVLGFLWTLLHPVLMMTVLTVVFSAMLQTEASAYCIHLFAGMLPFGFLSQSIGDSAYCIIHSEGLIRKIYVPKLVFPLSRVLLNLTTYCLSTAALFAVMVYLGAPITPALVALPAAILLMSAFTLGLSLAVATINTFYRDVGHLVSVILQAWYFATPILYDLSDFPPEVARRFWLNPAYPFIRLFEFILVRGEWPELSTFLLAAGIAAASLGVGYATFKSYEEKFVFRL